MTAPADVVNRALAQIAGQYTVSGTLPTFNGTPAGIAAGLLYNPCWQMLLRDQDTEFSRVTAALVAGGVATYPWSNAYLYPSDCLKIRSVVPATWPANDPQPVRWSEQDQVVTSGAGVPIAARFPYGINASADFTNGSGSILGVNSFTVGQGVQLTTTGVLPPNFALATTYYVIAAGLTGSAFQLSLTPGGAAIVAGSPDTGVHTATVCLAIPSTFTNGSGSISGVNSFAAGQTLQFTTTGTLPTNFALATTYFVLVTGLTGNTFELSLTLGGVAIIAGSAGSGTHTATQFLAVPSVFANGSAVISGVNSFSPGQTVQLTTAGTLPDHFATATTYYVVAAGLTGGGFELSLTPGGVAITAASAGAGIHTATQFFSSIFATNSFTAGQAVRFSTTGTLPIGYAISTTYYVLPTGLNESVFAVATTPGGAPIVAGSAGIGTQTVFPVVTAPMRVILSNVATASLVYTTSNVTEDMWDASFQEAVVRLLASELAMALGGRPDLSRVMLGQAGSILQSGEAKDS